MARVAGAGDGRSNRADITACFTAKTTRTQRGIARKRRLPGTGCLGHNPPTTKELSRTHINTTTHNHRTTTTPSIYPITHISTIRRYKSYHPHSRLRINQTYTTKITPSTKKEDFTDQPYRGVIHMIIGGSSVDFDTKRQKRDHYRSVNHVAITGPVVQTK
jgi:hypothetical protein